MSAHHALWVDSTAGSWVKCEMWGARNPFENEIYSSVSVFIRKLSYARHILQVRGTS